MICEDMICQAGSPFPRGKGGRYPLQKKKGFHWDNWEAQNTFPGMRGDGTDRFRAKEGQLVNLDNEVMLLPQPPKEENQFQTFASFTTEAGLVWNYLPPIPFLPLSSILITHSISNNSLQVENMWT